MQMQHLAEVAERGWLDSWSETLKEEAGGQMDALEAYQVMTGMCKDEEIELNLYAVNVKTKKSEMTYTRLQQTKKMDSEGKTTTVVRHAYHLSWQIQYTVR